MNDEAEHVLGRLTARGAPPELRGRVLDAVWAELRVAADAPVAVGARSPAGDGPEDAGRRAAAARPARYGRHMLLVVAASLVAAVGLNLLVHRTLDRRMAALLGAAPVQKQAAQLASEVASVTDRQTGQWVYQRLIAARPRPTTVGEYAAQLQQAIRQFTTDLTDNSHATTQEIPQMDWHRSGRDDRRPAGAQRLVRLEHRYTA